jgi:hypothetical protein
MGSTRPTVSVSCMATKENNVSFNHQAQKQDVLKTTFRKKYN